MENNQGNRESFATKFGVIAATAGSAVGLGNIWRFPYLTGENGGAAFIVIYLIFVMAFGIPVMLSEFVIGRSARKNPYGAFRKLAPGKPWFLVGLMGVAAAFMILAFYTTVAGWTLEYLYQSVINGFEGKDSDSAKRNVQPLQGQYLAACTLVLYFYGHDLRDHHLRREKRNRKIDGDHDAFVVCHPSGIVYPFAHAPWLNGRTEISFQS